MNKFILSILFSILLFFSGCDDFLNVEQRGVNSMENFYQTDDEAMQALMAIYDRMQSGNLDTFQYKNVLSDDAQPGGSGRSDNSGGWELHTFNIPASNYVLSNMFTKYYQIIYNANILLQRVSEDSEVKKLCRAEAKWFRAYAYFELTTLWGTVPLVLEPLEAGNYNQPNSTIEALYSQMETDLVEAIPVLPLKSQQSAADKARVSRGAAQALLGKVYLYQEKFLEAADMLDQVISSKEYDLYPDYNMITREESEFGCESVFEISYVANLTEVLESTCITAYCGPRNDGYFSPGTSGLTSAGWGYVSPNVGLREAFLEEGDIIRQRATVLNNDDMKELYGGSVCKEDGTVPYSCDGLVRTKYGAYMDEIAEANDQYHTIGGTNFRIIRFADVLLMAAEAHNRANNGTDDIAQEYVNKVRARVSLDPVSETGTALFERIKKERRLELAFEFVRFQDLIRWGDAATVLKDAGKRINLGTVDGNGNYQYEENTEAGFKPHNVLMPFPDTEISVNPYIKQNEGY